MADTKLSALTALTGANVDSAADLLLIDDISVTTDKKITVAQLLLGGPARTMQKFSTSQTYTTPAGLKYGLFYIKAGGGSGGGSTTTGNGGGGGEGETGWRYLTAAQLGSTQTVTIGDGGVAINANTNSAGNDGGTTSIGSLITALGGKGGAAGGTGTGGAGGNGGTNADWFERGAAGQAGGDLASTVAFNAFGGGNGGGAHGTVGVSGSGGGGGSGSVSEASGAGATGLFIAFEYYV